MGEKFGRKILLLAGGVVMFLSLLAATILAKVMENMGDDLTPEEQAHKKTLGYVLLVFVCVYAFGFGPWGAVPWVYPSEIFPMDVKERAMSTSVFSQWIANFLIAFMVPAQV